jgi:hypothetical protein
MLLKQQHFSVSGQAANQARQHPPVECVFRRSHPLLQFLSQKLAEWIANNYAAELNVPPRVRVRSVSRGYARPVLPIQHGTPSISGKKCQGEYIYMVYALYITCICWSYSWYIHVLT